jgi:hypothetical protein
MSDRPATKPRHGCFFYGGITAIILLVFVLVAALLGLRMARKMLDQYTDNAPMPLPRVQMSEPELSSLNQKVGQFVEAVEARRETAPLELTGREIDALIQTDSRFKALKDKLYVSIEGEVLKGQMSVSMAEAGLPVFQDRYLNGTGTFRVSLENGQLHILPIEILAKGKPVPEVYLQKIREQNLARNLNVNPGLSNALEHLKSVYVQEGKLVLVPKPVQ